jgi:hypothetical protein
VLNTIAEKDLYAASVQADGDFNLDLSKWGLEDLANVIIDADYIRCLVEQAIGVVVIVQFLGHAVSPESVGT